jgi:hypothetical protein
MRKLRRFTKIIQSNFNVHCVRRLKEITKEPSTLSLLRMRKLRRFIKIIQSNLNVHFVRRLREIREKTSTLSLLSYEEAEEVYI